MVWKVIVRRLHFFKMYQINMVLSVKSPVKTLLHESTKFLKKEVKNREEIQTANPFITGTIPFAIWPTFIYGHAVHVIPSMLWVF